MKNWTIFKLISWSETYFRSNFIDNPRLTAEILLSYGLDIKRIELYLQHDRPLNRDELSLYKRLVKRRINREPVAYITGVKGFYNNQFLTPPDVLIPRPDTETLVKTVLAFLETPDNKKRQPRKIIELGAGSGAIIISIADLHPEHTYYASDLSFGALKAVKANSEKLLEGIEINLFQSSWFNSIKKKLSFDVIISNPPYIKTSEIENLEEEIKIYEPRMALDGGVDGLVCLKEIIFNASDYLSQNGVLMLEMGYDQQKGIDDIVNMCPDLEDAEFKKDLAGNLRVAIIKKRLSKNN